jgi:hypothetical protein
MIICSNIVVDQESVAVLLNLMDVEQ